MGKAIAIAAQKDGCGKTNVAVNLVAALTKEGKRVRGCGLAGQRILKVYSQSGYKYRETPTITLKGAAGFDIGDYISVTCEDGRMVIMPDAERAKLDEAEAAFMEREMNALQKRFEAEKEKFHLQFVAEQTAQYGKEVAYV